MKSLSTSQTTRMLARAGRATACVGALWLTAACSDGGSNGVRSNSASNLHVLGALGEGQSSTTYLAPVESWTLGRLTFVANGTELGQVFNAVAVGNFIYAADFGEGAILQLTPDGNGGYLETARLLTTALTPQGFFRTVRPLGEDTLLLMTWPNTEGTVDWALIDIPAFTVRNSGSYVMQPVDNKYNPVEVGSPIVVGDKVYLGTMYWVEETGEFSTEMHTLVLDYPTFTNPLRFTTNRSIGSTGGWASQSMFADENGDIYQHNIRSKFWYNMGTAEQKPTVIARIKKGEMTYDEGYQFDVSAQFSETVSLIALTYAGNGVAYGAMLWEDQSTEWLEAYSQNRGFIAKIDLYNQTAIAMNFPNSPVLTTTGPLVKDGLFYMPLAPRGQQARVYVLDPQGGADSFEAGLELDGNNVEVRGLMETTGQ